jgi:hypothetical protein
MAAFLVALLCLTACGSDDDNGSTPGPEMHTITNPDVSLEGFTIHQPEDRMSDPRAGEPEYVYLVADEDAVEMDGPTITQDDGLDVQSLFIVDDPRIVDTMIRETPFEIILNDQLLYRVVIDDFEDEIDLAKVDLTLMDGEVRSEFVFVGVGRGVAHDVTICAVVEDEIIRCSEPLSIESRRR